MQCTVCLVLVRGVLSGAVRGVRCVGAGAHPQGQGQLAVMVFLFFHVLWEDVRVRRTGFLLPCALPWIRQGPPRPRVTPREPLPAALAGRDFTADASLGLQSQGRFPVLPPLWPASPDRRLSDRRRVTSPRAGLTVASHFPLLLKKPCHALVLLRRSGGIWLAWKGLLQEDPPGLSWVARGSRALTFR